MGKFKRIYMPHRLAENLMYLRSHYSKLSQQKFVWDLETFQSVVISRACYGSYEEGRSEPSVSLLKCIADYYEISIDDLCFRDFRSERESKRNQNKNAKAV